MTAKSLQGSSRLTLARPDIADAKLKGEVEASAFVDTRPMQVAGRGAAYVHEEPETSSRLATQALFGDVLDVCDPGNGDWLLAQNRRDNYVGWVRRDALTADVHDPTHKISVLRTIIFSAPDMKTPPVFMASLGSEICVVEEERNYVRLASGGWIHKRHAIPLEQTIASDFVSAAELFRGAPYVWGGKDSEGLDCSGLVQTSMRAAGLDVMRDADMQEGSIGEELEIRPDLSGLQRGDLIFWPGHVGIMLDAQTMLHANAYHMACQSEPLKDAAARIEASTKKAVRTIRRPSRLSA